MGLPLRSPVAKLSCEAATEENAKRRSFMPRTQVTGKANFSPGITSGLPVRSGAWALLIPIWYIFGGNQTRVINPRILFQLNEEVTERRGRTRASVVHHRHSWLRG